MVAAVGGHWSFNFGRYFLQQPSRKAFSMMLSSASEATKCFSRSSWTPK